MSETLPALDAPNPHPIHLVVTDDLERNRLTVFFRLILAIPLFIWVAIWGLAVSLVVLVAWVVGLITGRVPEPLHSFMASFTRYYTHVSAYIWIASDPYPGFTGATGYPVDLEIAPATSQSRLTILFRLILAIPAEIVTYVLQSVAGVVDGAHRFAAGGRPPPRSPDSRCHPNRQRPRGRARRRDGRA